MNSVLSTVRSLMQMFDDKAQEFISEIDNVHNVWLQEIQQEADRMFSRDFNAEPELMPKTPSQKKNTRRKRISVGRQEESQARRRYSRGRRSNLRSSAVRSLNLIDEEESTSEASTSQSSSSQSKRPVRKKKQTKAKATEKVNESADASRSEDEQNSEPVLVTEEITDPEEKPADPLSSIQSPPELPMPEAVVSISSAERLSAELAKKVEPSPGRSAAKIAIAGTRRSRRSSARCSLKLRHSLAGLRHSMTQESVRRASRRSMLKNKAARAENSTCSSNNGNSSCESVAEAASKEVLLEAVPADTVDNAAPESPTKSPATNHAPSVDPAYDRVTRSMATNSPSLAPSPLFFTKQKNSSDEDVTVGTESVRRSSRTLKRKAPDTEDNLSKRFTPLKKTQTTIKPNMRSFLHTVQKNQLLMMTPNSLSRSVVMKSFIKNTTPLKVDPKLNTGIVAKERHKLEALKKKQEQEEERMKRMEEEKRKKQEELKRKNDERLRRVYEAKVKEEQKEEEKKKRIEQKMAQIEKNDKRMAEEKAKRKVALKRQEELEQKKKLEEEAKRKIQQAEEDKRQQEILAQKKAEEEELRARKLAALELERQKEQQAAAERARVEKEKLLALQREVERAAREKEMRELEKKRKELEEKRKLEEQQRAAANEKALKEKEAAKQKEAAAKQVSALLNKTVDIERSVLNTPVGKGPLLNIAVNADEPTSPQSYALSPKGGKKPLTCTTESYGMDQNSDDSTDDESAPRNRIPSWAQGPNLQQALMKQYFNPPDLHSFFGEIEPIKLEDIFYKKKPRYFKRTSSAVWHSPLASSK